MSCIRQKQRGLGKWQAVLLVNNLGIIHVTFSTQVKLLAAFAPNTAADKQLLKRGSEFYMQATG